MTTKPRQVIFEVCKWIAERGEVNLYMDNILTSVCNNLDNNPGIPKIQQIQANTPLFDIG